MEIAKVFRTGRSQAVRIPRKFRFNVSEVEIRQEGNSIVLTPISRNDALKAFLEMPSFPDFKIEREESQKIQKRELFE